MLLLTNKIPKIHVNVNSDVGKSRVNTIIGTNNLILSFINSFVSITKIMTMAMILYLSEGSGVKFYN